LTKDAEEPADVMAPHADYVSVARKAEEKCRFCGFYKHPPGLSCSKCSLQKMRFDRSLGESV